MWQGKESESLLTLAFLALAKFQQPFDAARKSLVFGRLRGRPGQHRHHPDRLLIGEPRRALEGLDHCERSIEGFLVRHKQAHDRIGEDRCGEAPEFRHPCVCVD